MPARKAVAGIVPHRSAVLPNTAPIDAMNTRMAKTITLSGKSRVVTAPTANAEAFTIATAVSPAVRLQRSPPLLVNAARYAPMHAVAPAAGAPMTAPTRSGLAIATPLIRPPTTAGRAPGVRLKMCIGLSVARSRDDHDRV